MAGDALRGPIRLLWLLAGLTAVGLGGLGIVVPGLPTTGFFILAAWCFSKSSPRLEQWVLNLRGIGPMVRDYRAGLGMRRRAKVLAIGSMVLAGGLSVWLALDALAIRMAVATAVVIGVWFIAWRVPTTEAVLAGCADVDDGPHRAVRPGRRNAEARSRRGKRRRPSR